MNVVIQGNKQDIQVTSIILESDPLHPDMFTLFYCPKCGDTLFQYSGTVVMIVPGETKTKLPIIRQCRKCKTKYLINSIV